MAHTVGPKQEDCKAEQSKPQARKEGATASENQPETASKKHHESRTDKASQQITDELLELTASTNTNSAPSQPPMTDKLLEMTTCTNTDSISQQPPMAIKSSELTAGMTIDSASSQLLTPDESSELTAGMNIDSASSQLLTPDALELTAGTHIDSASYQLLTPDALELTAGTHIDSASYQLLTPDALELTAGTNIDSASSQLLTPDALELTAGTNIDSASSPLTPSELTETTKLQKRTGAEAFPMPGNQLSRKARCKRDPKREDEEPDGEDKPPPTKVSTMAGMGTGARSTTNQQPRLLAPLQLRTQTSADSGYSSGPDRAPIRASTVNYKHFSKFEDPETLARNSTPGATDDGGKGMINSTPESSLRNGQPSECVPGMNSPVVVYPDNNGKVGELVMPALSPVRPNNGKLQISRQLSLPVPTPHIERVVRRQSSSPPAISLDDDGDDDNNNNNR